MRYTLVLLVVASVLALLVVLGGAASLVASGLGL